MSLLANLFTLKRSLHHTFSLSLVQLSTSSVSISSPPQSSQIQRRTSSLVEVNQAIKA